MNIINIYGESESRTSKQESESKWQEVVDEIKKIEQRNESILIIGDLNKAVGNDHLGVRGSHGKITRGGNYIRELIESENYVIVNNTNACEGGPFTRYDPSDPENIEKKSTLDLAIVVKRIAPFCIKAENR